MTPSALTRRLLASLGLTTSALAGCDEEPFDAEACAKDQRTEEPAPGCSVTLGGLEDAEAFCVNVTLDAGACPPGADARVTEAAQRAPNYLTYNRIACELGLSGDGGGSPGGAAGECCYVAVVDSPDRCSVGRPFLVAGRPRVAPATCRSDWHTEPVAPAALSERARRALHAAWLADALAEHASVASFARFTLELLAFGAPADLVAGAQQAALDEVGHARRCFALASRYAGERLGPGALDEAGVEIAASLADLVGGVVKEGCVGETYAALLASRALEDARDPAVRATLSAIAEEEASHAALAWRTLLWALRIGGPALSEVARGAFAEALAKMAPGPDEVPEGGLEEMAAHGRLGIAARRAVLVEAREAVIMPCLRAVLTASTAVEQPRPSAQ